MTAAQDTKAVGQVEVPWFSIVISAYNRATLLARCVESCLAQSFRDFEIVIVDDGSTDDTERVVNSFRDSRVRLIRHAVNKGLCAARDTGARAATGRWIVQLDSDHGLLPGALANLHARTGAASEDVGVIGSRYLWDTGLVTPRFVPEAPIDYAGRIRWAAEEGGTDYLCCYRRHLYGAVAWHAERRGPLDGIFQLDLAKHARARIDADVIAIEYSDADNSQTRSKGWRGAKTLLHYAADMAWQYDEIFRAHGSAIAEYAPDAHVMNCRIASLFHFIAGNRGRGTQYALRYLRRRPISIKGWAILALGLADRRLLAYFRARRA